jgi:hypothetical protein
MIFSGELAWGVAFVLFGALILLNLPALVELDQISATKLRGWSAKALGSFLNRELWPSPVAGTQEAIRSSRLCLRIVAGMFLMGGFVVIAMSLWYQHEILKTLNP